MTNPVNNQNAEPQKMGSFMGNPANTSSAPQGDDYEALLLNDPRKFASRVKEDVRNEINQVEQQKAGVKQYWDQFYTENPDLKDVDWHVQSVLGSKLSELKDLPIPEASKKLAEEARRRIDLLRNKGGVRSEVLNSTNASVFPSSGEPIAKSTTSAPAENKTFVQEIYDMRQKKRSKN